MMKTGGCNQTGCRAAPAATVARQRAAGVARQRAAGVRAASQRRLRWPPGGALGLTVLLMLPLRAHGQASTPAEPAPVAALVELALTGRVEHPRTLTLADLQALPPVTVEATFATRQGPQTDSFTGVPLWTLLQAAAPLDDPGRSSHLRHTLLMQGRDGYTVALAIGELDPAFASKQVLVAYAQDGKPQPALRLIVPGDLRAGRSVRDLVAIEVR